MKKAGKSAYLDWQRRGAGTGNCSGNSLMKKAGTALPAGPLDYAYKNMESEHPLSVSKVQLSHQATNQVDGHVYLYTSSHYIWQLNANQRTVPDEVRGVELLVSTRNITDCARHLDRLPSLDLQVLFLT